MFHVLCLFVKESCEVNSLATVTSCSHILNPTVHHHLADELPEDAEAVLIQCTTCSLVVRVAYSLAAAHA